MADELSTELINKYGRDVLCAFIADWIGPDDFELKDELMANMKCELDDDEYRHFRSVCGESNSIMEHEPLYCNWNVSKIVPLEGGPGVWRLMSRSDEEPEFRRGTRAYDTEPDGPNGRGIHGTYWLGVQRIDQYGSLDEPVNVLVIYYTDPNTGDYEDCERRESEAGRDGNSLPISF